MWKLLEHQEVEDNFYFSSSMDDTGGNEKLNPTSAKSQKKRRIIDFTGTEIVGKSSILKSL